MMNFEESDRAYSACPPTNVSEWVEQQMAAIRAEAEQQDADPQTHSA